MNSRPLDPQSSALTRLRHTPEMGVSLSVSVGVKCKSMTFFDFYKCVATPFYERRVKNILPRTDDLPDFLDMAVGNRGMQVCVFLFTFPGLV